MSTNTNEVANDRRQTLINSLVASKGWLHSYAEAFVDDHTQSRSATSDAADSKQNHGIFAVDIFGNPMREYLPGKWELAAWPSDAAAAQPPSAAIAAEGIQNV